MCDTPALPSGLGNVEVAAGDIHTVARRSDGSLVAWGWNSYGQCNVPVLLSGQSYVEVSARVSRTVARYDSVPACGSVSLYCSPAAANSASPIGAWITVAGCPGLTANDLVFEVSGLPPKKPGMFFYGAQQTRVPFGNGMLCLGGAIQRVLPPLVSSAAGAARYKLDLSHAPFGAGPNAILPGSNWNFQYWYRDPAGGGSATNFSDAKHIVFAP